MIWVAIRLASGVKILREAELGAGVFLRPESVPFRVSPVAHLTGVIGALIVFGVFIRQGDNVAEKPVAAPGRAAGTIAETHVYQFPGRHADRSSLVCRH